MSDIFSGAPLSVDSFVTIKQPILCILRAEHLTHFLCLFDIVVASWLARPRPFRCRNEYTDGTSRGVLYLVSCYNTSHGYVVILLPYLWSYGQPVNDAVVLDDTVVFVVTKAYMTPSSGKRTRHVPGGMYTFVTTCATVLSRTTV